MSAPHEHAPVPRSPSSHPKTQPGQGSQFGPKYPASHTEHAVALRLPDAAVVEPVGHATQLAVTPCSAE